MSDTIHIGIDPGLSGGVAVIHTSGLVEAWHTPTLSYKTGSRTKVTTNKKTGKKTGGNAKVKKEYNVLAMAKLLRPFAKIHKDPERPIRVMVSLENVHAMPRDGKKHAFSFGHAQGVWVGIIGTLALPYELVSPSQWKPAMVGQGADKAASVRVCRMLYPAMDLPLKKDEAKAEAVLIAEFRRRKFNGMEMPKRLKGAASQTKKTQGKVTIARRKVIRKSKLLKRTS